MMFALIILRKNNEGREKLKQIGKMSKLLKLARSCKLEIFQKLKDFGNI